MRLPPEIAAKKKRIAELESECNELRQEIWSWWSGVSTELAAIGIGDTDQDHGEPSPGGLPDEPVTAGPGRALQGTVSQYRRVVDKVNETGRAMTSDQVADSLSRDGHRVPASSVRSYLPTAVRSGELKKVGRGKYASLSYRKRNGPAAAGRTDQTAQKATGRAPGVRETARELLIEAGGPLHLKVIEEGLNRSGLRLGGKNPYATLSATLRSFDDEFVNLGRNTFDLKRRTQKEETEENA